MSELVDTEKCLSCRCRACRAQQERLCGKALTMAACFTTWIVDCRAKKDAGNGTLPPIRLLTKEDLLQKETPQKGTPDKSQAAKACGTSTAQSDGKAGAGEERGGKQVFVDPKEVFSDAARDFAAHIKLVPKGGLVLDDELLSMSGDSFFECLECVCGCRLSPLFSHQDVVNEIRSRQIFAATASRLNTGGFPGTKAPLTRDELGALVEADQASLDALSAEDGDGEDSEDDGTEDSEPKYGPSTIPAGGTGSGSGVFDPAWIPDVQTLLDDEDYVEPLNFDADEFNAALFCDDVGFRDPYEGCEFKGYFQHKLFEFEDLQSNNDFAREFVSVPVLKQSESPQCADKYHSFILSPNEARVGMCAVPVTLARVLITRIDDICSKQLVQRRQEYLVMEEEEKKRKKREQIQEKLAREQKLREEEERKEARKQVLAAKQEKEREMQRALLEQKELERKLKKQAIQEKKRQQELEKQQRREERRRKAAEKKAQSLEQQANDPKQSVTAPSLSHSEQKLVMSVEPELDQKKNGESISSNPSKQPQKDDPVFAPTKPEYSLLFDAIFQLSQKELIPEQCETIQDQRISMDVLRTQNTNLQGFAVKLPPDYIVSQCPALSIIDKSQNEEKACAEVCHSPSQTVLESPSSDTPVSDSKPSVVVSKDENLDVQNNSEMEQCSGDDVSNDTVASESDDKQVASSEQDIALSERQNEDIPEMDQFDPQYLAFFDSLPLELFNANDLHPVPLPSYDLN